MNKSDNNKGYLTPSGLTGANTPEYGGKITVDEQVYWISGWKNTGKDGLEYITLRLKKNDNHQSTQSKRMPRKEM